MSNERRLRVNLATGIITDNPLTTTTTVVNSASFATLPVVDSATHLPLVFNPSQTAVPSTNAEIVYVTAHSSGATIATIVRAREGTVAAGYNVSTTWVHGPLVSDHSPTIVDTAGSLPSTGGLPYKGMIAYLSDTGQLQEYTSTSAWVDIYNPGAWTSWTPSFTGAWATGNGTVSGQYRKIGRLVFAKGSIIIGSSTTITSAQARIGGLPFAVANQSAYGLVNLRRTSTQTDFPGVWGVAAATTSGGVTIMAALPNGFVVNTPAIQGSPITYTTNDRFDFEICYEATS